jgi:plasmid stabilization system protein ParE
LDEILERSETKFGVVGRRRYEALVEQALMDLLEDPARPGVRIVADRMHYHLRYSRRRVPPTFGQVGRPRHLIIARAINEALVVLALAHDNMHDERMARIREGEADIEC